MKILYILNSANIYGGSTRSFMRYHEDLMKCHQDVCSVICSPVEPDLLKDLMPNERTAYYKVPFIFNIFPESNSIKDRLLFLPKLIYKKVRLLLAYKKLSAIVKAEKPDIIHTNVGVINTGCRVAQKMGIPHVYHLREFQNLDFGMKIMPSFQGFVKSLKQKGNYNICITRSIQNHFHLDDSNSVVIYNGVKKRTYVPLVAEKENYFLFVGRLDPSKGAEEVIRAFIAIRNQDKNLKLLLAGDATDMLYKKQLIDIVAEAKAEDRILFLGNRSDVDELMAKGLALIVASKSEAFGLISAEAQFNRCLFVGKRSSGTDEQIQNGKMIAGVEAGIGYSSIEELTTIMDKIAENPSRYDKTVDAGEMTAKELYSIEACSNNIYSLYGQISRRCGIPAAQ